MNNQPRQVDLISTLAWVGPMILISVRIVFGGWDAFLAFATLFAFCAPLGAIIVYLEIRNGGNDG